jgi:hypothetical protein
VLKIKNKLKIKLSYVPATELLSINPKECKSAYSTDIHTPMFVVAVITITKLWNQS